jgi:DNA ligase-1
MSSMEISDMATLQRRAFLAGLAAACLPALAARSHDGLMLASVAPADIEPAGFLVSEKFDGVRALWDGRSLHFRSGLPVAAPAWFLARLPQTALDGELWMARGHFEALVGAVRKNAPQDDEWRQIRYQVFDLPGAGGPFAERAGRVAGLVRAAGWSALQAVDQQRIVDRAALQRRLAEVVQGGGEGLVLHRADALWKAGRSDALLKLKPLNDAEARVLAHVPGRGKHAGRLGALKVRTAAGVEFLIGTGFSDAQREHPPALGALVTYTYSGSTSGGVPRFASFLRVRDL